MTEIPIEWLFWKDINGVEKNAIIPKDKRIESMSKILMAGGKSINAPFSQQNLWLLM